LTRTGIKALDRTVRRGGGRPTREEAEARDVRLLDVATKLFMERGFDGTSIEAVAEAAGVSKPTVYARYQDKRDLFVAVLRGRIQKWLAPLSAAAEAQAIEGCPKSIKTTLHELSRHMVAYTLAPEASWTTSNPLAYLTDVLTRIVNGHSNRDIELLPRAYEKQDLKAVA
jgi:TetR/AcrR family transcriptional regulator, mexJK operon transcriptional repressor